MAKKKDGLSPREELFVAAMMAHRHNQTAAAREAGYKNPTKAGSELMTRPPVKAAIEAAQRRVLKKYNVSGESIVQEMALIGFSNIEHYQVNDEDGAITLAAGAPQHAMRAIKRVKRKVRWELARNDDEKSEKIVEVEYELWNKDTQLRNLGEYKMLFKENRSTDDPQERENLTPAEREERVLAILRKYAKRAKQEKQAR